MTKYVIFASGTRSDYPIETPHPLNRFQRQNNVLCKIESDCRDVAKQSKSYTKAIQITNGVELINVRVHTTHEMQMQMS